jgi:hypothetical protein
MTIAAVLGSIGALFANSFRDAYVSTGMNLTQSILLSAVAVGRRGWDAVRGR